MSHGIDIFSDIFALRDNALTRLDARVKLLLAVEWLGCVLLSRQIVFPLSMFVVCLALVLVVAQTPMKVVLWRLAAPAGVVTMLVVLQGLLIGTTPWREWHVGTVRVAFMQEGLHLGVMTGARVFAAVSVVLLLSLVTPAHRIFHALRWVRVPGDWLEIAILMYRYIFTLVDMVADMTAAQRLRLGYRGARRGVRSLSELSGTVLIRSVDQAVRTHQAMQLRGYDGTLRFGALPEFSKLDKWVLAIGLGSVPVLYWWCERSWGV